MDLADLLRICEAYAKLGGAIQEQINDACNNNFDDCNANALKYVKEFMQKIALDNGDEGNQAAEEAAQVVEAIDEYFGQLKYEEENNAAQDQT